MRRLTVRLSKLTDRLDQVATERGTSRSEVVRDAVEAVVADQPLPEVAPPSESELLALLAERAREGNVSALRTLLTHAEAKDPVELLRRMVEDHRQ